MTSAVRRAAIAILCLLALWNSWEVRALFSDGAWFFVQVLHKGSFVNYSESAREYAIAASQLPLLLGIWAGMTDLHQLARLQSLGAHFLPTGLYVLALVRARDDAVLLSVVIACIVLVFMTNSFFIVGEYNTAHAIALAAATVVVAANRPRPVDGLLLVALAVVALRSYEVFVYLGPLLAAMTLWAASREIAAPQPVSGLFAPMLLVAAVTAAAYLGFYTAPAGAGVVLVAAALVALWRPDDRPMLARGLYMLAAALFMAGGVVAADSVARTAGVKGVAQLAAEGGAGMLDNLQFILVSAAAVILLVGAAIRPASLLRSGLYLLAAVPLVLLALLPVFVASGVRLRPMGTLQYPVRLVCGAILGAALCFLWLRGTAAGSRLALFATLDMPKAARRCLAFSFVMLLSILPSDILITLQWASFVDTVRTTVTKNTGIVAVTDQPAEVARFYWCCGDPMFIGPLSQALRSTLEDAIFAQPEGLVRLPALDLGKYFWRD